MYFKILSYAINPIPIVRELKIILSINLNKKLPDFYTLLLQFIQFNKYYWVVPQRAKGAPII